MKSNPPPPRRGRPCAPIVGLARQQGLGGWGAWWRGHHCILPLHCEECLRTKLLYTSKLYVAFVSWRAVVCQICSTILKKKTTGTELSYSTCSTKSLPSETLGCSRCHGPGNQSQSVHAPCIAPHPRSSTTAGAHHAQRWWACATPAWLSPIIRSGEAKERILPEPTFSEGAQKQWSLTSSMTCPSSTWSVCRGLRPKRWFGRTCLTRFDKGACRKCRRFRVDPPAPLSPPSPGNS